MTTSVGRVVAGLAQGIATSQSDYAAPVCLVLGGETTVTVRGAGLDARAALANNDSYHFLGGLGDLLITGPTLTNVNDLILVFVR